jgi:RNA polymerase sigma-70 factor (ECF subfamily)
VSQHVSTTHLLGLVHAGDNAARAELIEHTMRRFQVLARRMFRGYANLRSTVDTDDVAQRAMIRLHKALRHVQPMNGRELFGLAARQIRWVLLDVCRRLADAPTISFTDKPDRIEPNDQEGEPSDLCAWTEFHERINGLPHEQRELFDVLFYQGVTQVDAAKLLGIPLRSLKRRWQEAKLRLRDGMRGEWPTAEVKR